MLLRSDQIQLGNIIVALMISFTVFAYAVTSHGFQNTASAEHIVHEITSAPASSPLSRQRDEPVFRFAVSGGVRGVQKPVDKLLIFNNGNVLVTGDIGVSDRKAKLSVDDLKKFKSFLLTQNSFFNLDSVEIEKRMNRNGATGVIDGNCSIFSANFDGKVHEVEIYSLWAATKSFPNFDEVKKCEAIEKRCKAIISAVNLGDRGPEVLKAINDEIENRNLGIQPFKLNEMRLTSQLPGGRFQVSFSRTLIEKSDGSQRAMHAIYFVQNADAVPKVSFYGLSKK